MEQVLREAMRTALRVLTALTEMTTPNEQDVDALRLHAPLFAESPVDELAREVVQDALRHRAEAPFRSAVLQS
jgi:hypothetical protein